MSQVCVERGMMSGQVPRDPAVNVGLGGESNTSSWVAPVLSVHHSATDCAPWLDMEG